MSNDILWAEAILGKEASDFAESDIGRYLIGRCDQEIAEAQEKLNVVSSWRTKRITQLQNEIWRATSLKSWLAELIQAGRQAEKLLEGYDE